MNLVVNFLKTDNIFSALIFSPRPNTNEGVVFVRRGHKPRGRRLMKVK